MNFVYGSKCSSINDYPKASTYILSALSMEITVIIFEIVLY